MVYYEEPQVLLVANKKYDQNMLDKVNLNIINIHKYIYMSFLLFCYSLLDDILCVAIQISAICLADDAKAKKLCFFVYINRNHNILPFTI